VAVIRCTTCGAVVTARRLEGKIETSYGADFRAKCRELADRFGIDFISSAVECPKMETALKRAAFRLAPRARAASPRRIAPGAVSP